MQKYVVELVDDIDGSEADESVRFALDGKAFVIDLSGANADKLREAFGPYVNAARKSAVGPAPTKSKSRPGDLDAVRDWLRGQGHTVSSRGRIPKSLMEEYDAAH